MTEAQYCTAGTCGSAPRVPMVVCAMTEEAEPFMDRARRCEPYGGFGNARFFMTLGQSGSFLLCISGIGGTNAASAVTASIFTFTPSHVIYAGTAGGLAHDIAVTDVVCGERYRYGSADATAFGYERGQIPGMPPFYSADEHLLSLAQSVAGGQSVRVGDMLSSDSFITAKQAPDMRRDFPDALATDMETAYAAQVCATYRLPFIAVRGISDLCSPDGADVFHVNTDVAAGVCADVVMPLVDALM